MPGSTSWPGARASRRARGRRRRGRAAPLRRGPRGEPGRARGRRGAAGAARPARAQARRLDRGGARARRALPRAARRARRAPRSRSRRPRRGSRGAGRAGRAGAPALRATRAEGRAEARRGGARAARRRWRWTARSFEIALAPRDETGPTGADAVEFLIAPNPGVPAGAAARDGIGRRGLARDARAAGRGQRGVARATLVFDEVDAGIGGQTARAVGEELRALAAGRQMVCITHLPQIASLADAPFRDREGPLGRARAHDGARARQGRDRRRARAHAGRGGRRRRRPPACARSCSRPRSRP